MRSRKEKILKYLRTHKRGITTLQAAHLFGEYRLSGRIFDLRQDGHVIDSERVEVMNRDGRKVQVVAYHLIKEKE